MKNRCLNTALAALTLAALALFAAGKGMPATAPESQPAGKQVNIDNFSFTPETLTVPVGTPVTGVNHDDIPHTVVSTEKGFKSPVLDTDERFSYTFTAPGTYNFHCSIHPKMVGKIVVQGK
jgi:plastocyanin